MHDNVPPIPDDPAAQGSRAAQTPFGAGVPLEKVEPVRLTTGERRGPALDVRGQSAPSRDPRASASASSQAPSFATAPPGASGAAGWSSAGSSAAGSSTSEWSTAGSTAAGFGATAAAGSPPPPGTPPYAQSPAGAGPAKPKGRWWIGLAHLSFLIPFPPGVVITAALWIWRRDRDALMSDQGREALNMQLTFWLVMGILGASCLGSALVPFVYVLGAVLCILAAIAAGNGDRHRYPWVFRFLT